MWEFLCEVSRKDFEVLYRALGVKVYEVGESFYNSMIPGVLDKLTQVKFYFVQMNVVSLFNATLSSDDIPYKQRVVV